MRIALVYGNDGSDVRIAKNCGTLSRLGHEVHFIGWDRRPDVAKVTSLPGVHCHVIPHRVPTLGSTLSGQLAFTRHAIRTLLHIRPDVVTVVNEDNAARVGWLKGVAFRRLVCDVFDSQLDKMSHRPWPVRAAGWCLWNSMRWWCDRLIATDDVRWGTFGRFRSKTIVIGNYPPDPGPELSRQFPQGRPRLFVSGTFSDTRGMRQTLLAAERIPGFRIVAAGWPGDDYARDVFLKHPAVEYLGHLTPGESLHQAARCDALLAMYAPISRNQVLASPNKIYDALSVGRPVIINSEARVSDWVRRHDVGFTCPYEDIDALAGFFATLQQRRETLPEYARRARSLFAEGYSWEAMEVRLAALYAALDSDSQTKPDRERSGITTHLTQHRAA